MVFIALSSEQVIDLRAGAGIRLLGAIQTVIQQFAQPAVRVIEATNDLGLSDDFTSAFKELVAHKSDFWPQPQMPQYAFSSLP
jgi:hypothetical protein